MDGTFKRSKAQVGRKARQDGINFEELFKRHCNFQGIKWVQVPSGFKGWGKSMRPCKTYLDFVLIKDGISIFLDCKSFDDKRISHSMLTWHQVFELVSIKEHGCEAGYLVYLRPLESIVFFDADTLMGLQPGKSLGLENGAYLGSITTLDLKPLFVKT